MMSCRVVSPLLPNRLLGPLGRFMGALFCNIVLPVKRHVLSRLHDGFPEKSETEIRELFQKTVRNGGEVLFEQLMVNRKLMTRELERVRGREEFDRIVSEACGRGRGVIILGSHMGNWEKLMGIMAHRIRAVTGRASHVVMFRMPTPYIDRLATRLRNHVLGCQFVYVKRARYFINRILRNREALIFATDVDFQYRGLFVPFMDRMVSTGRGPAHYAVVREVPLLFVMIYTEHDGTLHMHTEEVVPERTGNTERDIRQLTARLAARLEYWVRRYPEQWFGWLQNPWKTRPGEELMDRLVKEPGNPEICEAAGQYCLAVGNKVEAREMFRRALDLDPRRVRSQSQLGWILLEEGAVEEGISCLFRALEMKPGDVPTLKYMGRFLVDRGLFKSGLSYFKRAVHVKYDDAEAYWGMGRCLEGMGKRGKAVEIYRKGLKVDDDYGPLHLALVRLLAKQPDQREKVKAHLDSLEMLSVPIPVADRTFSA